MGREHLLIDVYVTKRDRNYRNLRRHMNRLGLHPEYHVTGTDELQPVSAVMQSIDHHPQPMRVYVRRGDKFHAWRMQSAYFGYTGRLRRGMRQLKADISHPYFSNYAHQS